MKEHSSVIRPNGTLLSRAAGAGWGLLGVVAFSFTLPFTRIALGGGLSPLFIGSARAVVAAVLAAVVLLVTRQQAPSPVQWARLAVVALGVVAGFPLLTSFAMTTTPASHGAVVIGLLPAATAVAVVLRTRERPSASFWVFALLGSAAALVFATVQNGTPGALRPADLQLFGAVIAAAVGYAEGGLLARELGAWQTISWALVLAAPVMLAVTVAAGVAAPPIASPTAWLAFAYLAAVSMFLGFFAWYRGLAIGPMAQVSQIQLVQPVMGITWAAFLFHEDVGVATVLGGLAVVVCAGLAVRTRSSSPTPTPTRQEAPCVTPPATS
ncbi:DMT family transporter [Microbacterium sp. HSID17254]|uniref:DMT family transporter n=1 Tax=Microbacterium sp. HSID17254 TaxID=2419509 RepID=UPI000F876ED7|nr:DMT family transporter [Microbacterium sp. HSID17254]RUQ05204.1 DMT family transporter [Microbacterium sp. HSID17254]